MNLHIAEFMAISLMEKHGLHEKGWRFAFDNATRRFGCCKYRAKEITLSRSLTLLNDEKRVRNTILHEIAHALCPKQKHNSVWKAKAIEIGCDGARCYSLDDVVIPETKYIAKCSYCGNLARKNRKPKRRESCGVCSPRVFDEKYIMPYIENPNHPSFNRQ